jgi:hypothetical protein
VEAGDVSAGLRPPSRNCHPERSEGPRSQDVFDSEVPRWRSG